MSAETEQPRQGPDAIDADVTLARVGGDVDLLQEIIRLFLEECPQLMDKIRVALADGDAGQMQMAAHTLRGSVSNFGASAAVEAARQLEATARTQDLKGAAPMLQTLEQEIERVSSALQGLLHARPAV